VNPLVEKMLIAQREGIDASTLEQIFEHEVECESKHVDPENRYCSARVLFIGYSCSPPMMICGAAGQVWQRWVDEGDLICDDCGIPLTECWTIRPI